MTHEGLKKRHFERLNAYRLSAEFAEYAGAIGGDVPAGPLPSLVGARWEIDRDIYEEFLEMLPPLGWRGGTFYMCEFSFGDITAKFTREGDRYFCEHAHYPPRRATAVPFADRVRDGGGPADGGRGARQSPKTVNAVDGKNRLVAQLPWVGAWLPAVEAGCRYPNIRLCNPATFFIITVCRDRGFRFRSAAIRHTFIFPIPCSTTTRRRASRRFPAFCRGVNGRPRGLRVGTCNRVPRYAVSPVPGTPAGSSSPDRSYTFLSCVAPGAAADTAAIRTFRFRGPPRPGRFFFRTTTWCLIVCRFFLPE